jgi:5-methylcytosine-specific restriction endonuclease McrA
MKRSPMKRNVRKLACEGCGESFEQRRIGQRYCSRRCAISAIGSTGAGARASAAKRHNPPVVKTCPICGITFAVRPTTVGWRKTCSVSCAAKLKRRAALERNFHRGAANPQYRHGDRVGFNDSRDQERWRTGAAKRCQNPDCRGNGGVLALHHVVYRQRVLREGGDAWDPRNGMTLCNACHMGHHSRSRVLSVDVIPPAAVEFAADLFGATRARLYFDRYYRDH